MYRRSIIVIVFFWLSVARSNIADLFQSLSGKLIGRRVFYLKDDILVIQIFLAEQEYVWMLGDYTAAAIGSFAFDIPAAVVDGNVYRVLSRYFGIDTPINSTHLYFV